MVKSWFPHLFAFSALLTLNPENSFSQVSYFTKDFKNVTVPCNATDGLTVDFDVPMSGTITQFWWSYTSNGWRDLHITYTSPGGTSLEQVAGKPWSDVGPIFGKKAGGRWTVNLKETVPGNPHLLNTGVAMTVLRSANPNLPVSGTVCPALDGVDSLIVNWLRKNEFEAATLAVMRNRRRVYTKGYGWQDYGRTTPTRPDAVMRLASNTKMITACAIRKLAAEDRLALTDKLYDVLNIAPPAGGSLKDPRVRDITIQQVLDHTSGLADNAPGIGEIGKTLGLGRSATLTETIAFMWTRDLSFAPGVGNQYSNLGYQMLGAVVEELSGMSYDAYVRLRIARPLGITSLQVAKSGENEKAPNEIWYAGHAYSHLDTDADHNQPMVSEAYAGTADVRPAAGSLICSAPDYCRFLKSYYHNGHPKQADLKGVSWTYTFYGSMPGTWTLTRDTITPDGNSITYVFLTNERTDKPEDPENSLTKQLDTFFAAVANWPETDLFGER